VPLVTEAFDWQHGVFLGSIMSSEKTAAAAGKVGELRFDPFAMLPFCGYNMGDYFDHWLDIGRASTEREGDASKLPKLYWVNWFRKGDDGSFLWPGFGDNSRVLKWVIERLDDSAGAVDTAIGRVPAVDAVDVSGLDLADTVVAELLDVDNEAWRQEIPQIEAHFEHLGAHVPAELRDELNELQKRLAE
jgi:phosphoenolpyruvate carboxykinase (GTP)